MTSEISNYIHQFFFGIYPYLAIVIMVGVSIARYDRDQYTYFWQLMFCWAQYASLPTFV